MNCITKFLGGVLLWAVLFLIGPIPFDMSRAWAQACLHRDQMCPAGMVAVQMPPNTFSPDPLCDHVCIQGGAPMPPPPVPGQPGNPTPSRPLCLDFPDNPACRR